MSRLTSELKAFGPDLSATLLEIYLRLDEVNGLTESNLRSRRQIELNGNIEKTKQQMNDIFNDLVKSINNRRNELLNELESIRKEKEKELKEQGNRDTKIKKVLENYRESIRKAMCDTTMSVENKRNKMISIIEEYKSNKDLIPNIDDITLTMASLRSSNEVLEQTIKTFGTIDQQDEKQVENLAKQWKLTNGELKITINGGKDLPAMDKSGTSDPYVVIEIGKKSFKTKYISKTLNPSWNEIFTFSIKDPIHEKIFVKVFDYNAFGNATKMGDVTIPIVNILKSPGGCIMEKDFPLENSRSGTLSFNFEYSEL